MTMLPPEQCPFCTADARALERVGLVFVCSCCAREIVDQSNDVKVLMADRAGNGRPPRAG